VVAFLSHRRNTWQLFVFFIILTSYHRPGGMYTVTRA
jgi:hypothetical protein